MRWAKILKLDCTKAERYCDKQQYKDANPLEKMKLRLHLLFCKTCLQYSKKNSQLSDLIKKASLKTCTKEEKEEFKRKIEREF